MAQSACRRRRALPPGLRRLRHDQHAPVDAPLDAQRRRRLDIIPAWKKFCRCRSPTMEELRDRTCARNWREKPSRRADRFFAPLGFDWRQESQPRGKTKLSKARASPSLPPCSTKRPSMPCSISLWRKIWKPTFEDSTTQGDEQAVQGNFLNPNVLLGQSDAGAHVASGNPGFGFATLCSPIGCASEVHDARRRH